MPPAADVLRPPALPEENVLRSAEPTTVGCTCALPRAVWPPRRDDPAEPARRVLTPAEPLRFGSAGDAFAGLP